MHRDYKSHYSLRPALRWKRKEKERRCLEERQLEGGAEERLLVKCMDASKEYGKFALTCPMMNDNDVYSFAK
jgi:hypothetical protein